MSKTVWDEYQIRCAINYALENCVILWPLHNQRFKIQNKVISLLYQFDKDLADINKPGGYIDKQIEDAKRILEMKDEV